MKTIICAFFYLAITSFLMGTNNFGFSKAVYTTNEEAKSENPIVTPMLGQFNEDETRDVNAPDNVSISVVNGIVTLSWSPAANATSYIVEGSGICDSCFSDVSSTGSFSNSEGYVHWEKSSPEHFQFYRVRSVMSDLPANFILVEGGTFNNHISDVTLSTFYIDKFETTQGSYLAVMGNNPSIEFGVGSNYPVYYVSWFDAIEYCNCRSLLEGLTPCYSYSTFGTNPDNWTVGWDADQNNHVNVACNWTVNGYRLPTSMEWMYTAWSGNLHQNTLYSGSSDMMWFGWHCYNSGNRTHEVGTLMPNLLGTYDMSGNVWEWVWDIYGPYPEDAQTNPTGVTLGSTRTIRGGYFYSLPEGCEVTFRYNYTPTYIDKGIGFRICRSAP